MISIQGVLEHITFHNAQNYFTIARLKTDAPKTTVTIAGLLPQAGVGETIRVTGDWTTHPRFGQQFKFETAEIVLPATIAGIRHYLASGILKGVGPATARRIIEAFGEDTFGVLSEDPERLAGVTGIGPQKAADIHEQWQTRHAVTAIMKFLQENGISTALAGKILKTYGNDAVAVIRQDPYGLARDIPGIGFAAADRIAAAAGLDMDPAGRAGAWVISLLREALNDGHTFLPETELMKKSGPMPGMDAETVRQAIRHLDHTGEAVTFTLPDEAGPDAVYLKPLHDAETAIAAKLQALLSIPAARPSESLEALLNEVESQLVLRLSEEQRQILETVIHCRVGVITGGPGTGKTTLVKAITRMNRRLGRRVCLAAPTGRAARRLAEVTGHKAHTIHKLLEYNFESQSFGKDRDDPIDADILIIDEVSMVDTVLMHHLLSAVPMRASVILVGDAHQLPPVGPGAVLGDIIAANRLPVFYLNTIFRQAQKSPIIMNAHRVRHGESPQLADLGNVLDPGAEFHFIEQPTPEAVAETVVHLCARRLPDLLGLRPIEDIQVLSPMHKGLAGTIHLNRAIQQALNTASGSLSHNGTRFKTGDKVMHLKNNYQKEVFNGDIGIITEIDKAEGLVYVDYDGRTVTYTLDETEDLTLGYAISVHKSQGSEYPAIILPLITQHYVMLQRNLLYTAITRAQKHVVIVGSRKAMDMAVRNDTPQKRYSGLVHRLRGLASSAGPDEI